MDTITHALSGALLAIATAPGRSPSAATHTDVRVSREAGCRERPEHMDPGAAHPDALSQRARLMAGAAAAAFPDLDFILRAIDTLTYLNLHQGVTHSLILLPVWALALAWLFSLLSRQRYRWTAFYGIAAMGLAIHIGGDLITAYGTQLLAPFSAARFSWPLVFVIDPIISVILIAGLVAARLWPARQLAPVAFLVLAGYLGLQALLQQRAIDTGADYARAQRLEAAVSHALPQPLSPFHWLIIVQHDDTYHEARVNLAGGHRASAPATAGFFTQLVASFQPVAAANWTRHTRFGEHPTDWALARPAFEHEALADFRRFARFLALDHIETQRDRVCVWFTDLRFSLPGLPPSFRYGLCRAGSDSDWRLARLRGSFYID
jgi:inner membrane protein